MARKAKGTPAWYRDRCFDLWAERVKEAADNRCEKCGKPGPGLHSHHVRPRGKSRLAFDIRNGVCLCYRHHIHWAHKDATDFSQWFQRIRQSDYQHIWQPELQRPYKRTIFEWEGLYERLKSASIEELRDQLRRAA